MAYLNINEKNISFFGENREEWIKQKNRYFFLEKDDPWGERACICEKDIFDERWVFNPYLLQRLKSKLIKNILKKNKYQWEKIETLLLTL